MCDWLDIDWEDWLYIGPLAEDLADKEKNYEKNEKDFFDDDSEDEDDFS